MERQQKLISGAPEEVREKLLQEVLVLEDSAEGAELFETSEEMNELMVERKTKAEESRVSDTAGPDVRCEGRVWSPNL